MADKEIRQTPVSKTLRANLSALAVAYARAESCSISTVSHKFYGNSTFFADFKRGGLSISIDKYGQIIAAMQAAWPAEAAWPTLRAVVIPRRPFTVS